jgi:hypothetical protein
MADVPLWVVPIACVSTVVVLLTLLARLDTLFRRNEELQRKRDGVRLTRVERDAFETLQRSLRDGDGNGP